MMAAGKITMSQAMFIGLGNIIGAGIFVLAGTAIHIAGPGALLAFIITATLATTVALNSAELSSKVVAHGGLYSFVRTTMGDAMGFIVGWLRAISYAIAAAAVSLGFSSYVGVLLHTENFMIPISIIMIVAVAFVDYSGLRLVARIEQYLVFITVGGLAAFIVASLFYGSWKASSFTPLLPGGFSGLIVAASLAFFAYSGFNTIATLTPEVEDGQRNVPRAIIISLVISTVLYILVVAGMLAMMPWTLYGITANPLSNAIQYSHAPQLLNYVVSGVAIIATLTVTMSLVVAGSRTLLQMAEDGMLPSWVAGRHADSPRRGVLVICMLAVLSLFIGNLKYIALASNFGVVFSYALTGLAVVILRRRGVGGAFESPFYPALQIVSVVLSFVVMAALGEQALYLGTLMILSGVITYGFVRGRAFHRSMDEGT